MMKSQKNIDTKKAVTLNTVSVFIYFFAQWLLTIVLTRISGYKDSGLFTLAVSFTNIFCYLSNAGVRNVQISDTSRKTEKNVYFSTRFLTSALSILLFAITIAFVRYDELSVKCCITMMIFKIFESYRDVLMGELQLQNRYDLIARSYIMKSILIVLAFVVALFIGLSLPLSILSMAVAYGGVLFLYDFRKLKIYRDFAWNIDGSKELLMISFPLTVSTILDAVILFIPKHFVEILLGSEQLGYYGTVTIVIIVLSTLGSSVWTSLIPVYSKAFIERDDESVFKMNRLIVVSLGLLSIMLLTVGRLIAPFFYKLLFGEKILDYMYLLPSVIINSLLLLFNSFFICILVPLRKNRLFAISDLFAVVVLVPLCYFLCKNNHLLGASNSLSIALFVKLVLLLTGTFISLNQRKKEVDSI